MLLFPFLKLDSGKQLWSSLGLMLESCKINGNQVLFLCGALYIIIHLKIFLLKNVKHQFLIDGSGRLLGILFCILIFDECRN